MLSLEHLIRRMKLMVAHARECGREWEPRAAGHVVGAQESGTVIMCPVAGAVMSLETLVLPD